MKAFREWLKNVHQYEDAEHAGRRLAARIKQVLRGNVGREDFNVSGRPMALRHGR